MKRSFRRTVVGAIVGVFTVTPLVPQLASAQVPAEGPTRTSVILALVSELQPDGAVIKPLPGERPKLLLMVAENSATPALLAIAVRKAADVASGAIQLRPGTPVIVSEASTRRVTPGQLRWAQQVLTSLRDARERPITGLDEDVRALEIPIVTGASD